MSKRHTSAPLPAKGAGNAGRKQWLPAVLVIAALAVVGLIFWFTLGQETAGDFAPEVTGQPKAVISQADFDYGDVKLGTTIETVFRVKNTGDQPLVFLREPDVEVLEGC